MGTAQVCLSKLTLGADARRHPLYNPARQKQSFQSFKSTLDRTPSSCVSHMQWYLSHTCTAFTNPCDHPCRQHPQRRCRRRRPRHHSSTRPRAADERGRTQRITVLGSPPLRPCRHAPAPSLGRSHRRCRVGETQRRRRRNSAAAVWRSKCASRSTSLEDIPLVVVQALPVLLPVPAMGLF